MTLMQKLERAATLEYDHIGNSDNLVQEDDEVVGRAKSFNLLDTIKRSSSSKVRSDKPLQQIHIQQHNQTVTEAALLKRLSPVNAPLDGVAAAPAINLNRSGSRSSNENKSRTTFSTHAESMSASSVEQDEGDKAFDNFRGSRHTMSLESRHREQQRIHHPSDADYDEDDDDDIHHSHLAHHHGYIFEESEDEYDWAALAVPRGFRQQMANGQAVAPSTSEGHKLMSPSERTARLLNRLASREGPSLSAESSSGDTGTMGNTIADTIANTTTLSSGGPSKGGDSGVLLSPPHSTSSAPSATSRNSASSWDDEEDDEEDGDDEEGDGGAGSREVSLLDRVESRDEAESAANTDVDDTGDETDNETVRSTETEFEEFGEIDGLKALGGVIYQLGSCNFTNSHEDNCDDDEYTVDSEAFPEGLPPNHPRRIVTTKTPTGSGSNTAPRGKSPRSPLKSPYRKHLGPSPAHARSQSMQSTKQAMQKWTSYLGLSRDWSAPAAIPRDNANVVETTNDASRTFLQSMFSCQG